MDENRVIAPPLPLRKPQESHCPMKAQKEGCGHPCAHICTLIQAFFSHIKD